MELPLVFLHLFLIANNQDKLRLIWQGRIRFSRTTTSGNGILTSVDASGIELWETSPREMII